MGKDNGIIYSCDHKNDPLSLEEKDCPYITAEEKRITQCAVCRKYFCSKHTHTLKFNTFVQMDSSEKRYYMAQKINKLDKVFNRFHRKDSYSNQWEICESCLNKRHDWILAGISKQFKLWSNREVNDRKALKKIQKIFNLFNKIGLKFGVNINE